MSLILGIETSCDETAAAVVEGGVVIRSNVIATQHKLHERYGGVVPELASRAHLERISPVIAEALATAGVTFAEIDAVAVGNRPGLIGSLLVGVSAAKALAWSLGRPLIGIDHVKAHLYAGLMGKAKSPESGVRSPESRSRTVTVESGTKGSASDLRDSGLWTLPRARSGHLGRAYFALSAGVAHRDAGDWADD